MCLPTVAVAAEDLLDEANRQCPVSLADTTVGWVTVHVPPLDIYHYLTLFHYYNLGLGMASLGKKSYIYL